MYIKFLVSQSIQYNLPHLTDLNLNKFSFSQIEKSVFLVKGQKFNPFLIYILSVFTGSKIFCKYYAKK